MREREREREGQKKKKKERDNFANYLETATERGREEKTQRSLFWKIPNGLEIWRGRVVLLACYLVFGSVCLVRIAPLQGPIGSGITWA